MQSLLVTMSISRCVLVARHAQLSLVSIIQPQSLQLMQENLSTAKVPVAVKAAGVDADGHWTRQNLAQVIWYSLLLLHLCQFTTAAYLTSGARQQQAHWQSQHKGSGKHSGPSLFLVASSTRRLYPQCALFSGIQATCSGGYWPGDAVHQAQRPCARSAKGSIGRVHLCKQVHTVCNVSFSCFA